MAHVRKVETTKRRNGRTVAHYEVRWSEVEVTPQGLRRKRYRQETYPTRAAADDRAAEIESSLSATGSVTGREARLEPYGGYAAAWLDSLTGTIKARTLAEYRRLYAHYAEEPFATRPVGSISPADARTFRAGLVERGLSRKTVVNVFDVFRRVLDAAVTDGALPSNPAHSLPRLRDGDAQPFAPHPLTSEQVAAVSDHIGARYPIYGFVVLFLACTGLRTGELAGLEIGDVRLAGRGGSIAVRRTKRKVRGGWETGTPKSRKSRRTVPLDGWLADDLRAYLATHPRSGDPEAPLFPARYGYRSKGVARSILVATVEHPATLDSYNWTAPVDPGTLYSNYFRPALRAVGLPASAPATDDAPAIRGVRLHDLRHSFAVLSLTAGAHYMQVSKWLGHESFVTTLTIYGDYIDEDEGKSVPLARPTARTGNVVPLHRTDTA
ncbi:MULTISPECIES: site-specific integrase [unclassified Pseudonocardia]|uniref:tyrosine-type recombinase/integrase n=1 Tax=unclassified Pseudonocardia TaxID=2619320 RepID=UPI0001FFE7C4|nr:site-specific integrase [Pseudonocardia sp. Ae707_Ps1]OLM17598.1 Integrase [Pseudonocardia sp. Ae707_Ps1]